MNKSLATNLISASLIPISLLFSGTPREIVMSIGLFATSGAVTNWLAVYMLFERVPMLYGSGVIPSRFEEFKSGIRHLIMNQFFTRENLERFLSTTDGFGLDKETLLESIDFSQVWQKLVAAIMESPLGNMVGMFGGPQALDSIEKPFTEKLRKVVHDIVDSGGLQEKLKATSDPSSWMGKVDDIVARRLDELTPKMVKEIIQEMIRRHLGWLVVWGGAFGGLIGAVTASIRLA